VLLGLLPAVRACSCCWLACQTASGVSIRQHTSAYVSIRQHTSAYVSIRQHTVSAYVSCPRTQLLLRQYLYLCASQQVLWYQQRKHPKLPARQRRLGSGHSWAEAAGMLACCCAKSWPASIRQHTSAYVSIRQHTSAYVSIRQHTSAYVSMRQHTSCLRVLLLVYETLSY
jgi:isocitrate/isopropylmalate dehydrogenase